MTLHVAVPLVLQCLAAVGFAMRGIALLRMRKCNPHRIISVSGVAAMISVWLIAIITPQIFYGFPHIYAEFDLTAPWVTELTLSILDPAITTGLFWYPFACAFGVFALIMPEILFYQPRSK
jgi:hypothetical protein